MSPAPQDDLNGPRPAGPVGAGTHASAAGPGAPDGGDLRRDSSSAPPSAPPPAGEELGKDIQGRGADSSSPEGREAGGSPNAAAGREAGEAEAAEEVEHDLEALLRERDEYLELAKRTKADFENFRKRMAADAQAAGARGRGELAGDVVPVLDDLERALEAAGLDPEGDSDDGLAHGVLLVFRALREALQRNGIEAVDPRGERFDPQAHEALSTQLVDGAETGVVVDVVQKGYRLGEQLIRPARVVVAE